MTILGGPIDYFELFYSPDGSVERGIWVPFSSITNGGTPIVTEEHADDAAKEGDDMLFMGRIRLCFPDGQKVEFIIGNNKEET